MPCMDSTFMSSGFVVLKYTSFWAATEKNIVINRERKNTDLNFIEHSGQLYMYCAKRGDVSTGIFYSEKSSFSTLS